MGSSILQSKAKKTVSPTARSSLPAREPEPVPKRSSLPDRMDHAKNVTMAATPSRSSLGPLGPDDHMLRPRASTLSKSIGKKSHSVELVSKKDSVFVSGERVSVPLSGRKRPVASSRPHTWATNMGAASSASSAGSSFKTLGTVQPSREDVSVVVDDGGGNDGRLTVLSEASAEGGAEVPERRGRDSDLSGKATVENSLEKASVLSFSECNCKSIIVVSILVCDTDMDHYSRHLQSHDDVTTKMWGSSNVHASQANADEPGDFHDDFVSTSSSTTCIRVSVPDIQNWFLPAHFICTSRRYFRSHTKRSSTPEQASPPRNADSLTHSETELKLAPVLTGP
jgi:hypothetical protein